MYDATIDALVTLLQRESDEANLAIIRSHLLAYGEAALPALDRAASQPDQTGPGPEVASLVLQIRRSLLEVDWSHWASRADPDLETGVLLIDRFGDPSVDERAVRCELDALADGLTAQLGANRGSSAAIAGLTDYFFREMGFRGNRTAYEDPENSYLSCVLSRRTGIPVSLSVMVLLVAERVGLPVVGIGMPGHFIVRYGFSEVGPYLDPFGGGRILSREQCVAWVRASGFEFTPRMLDPSDSSEIVARMLRNLVNSFSAQDASAEVEILKKFLTLATTAGKEAVTSEVPDLGHKP